MSHVFLVYDAGGARCLSAEDIDLEVLKEHCAKRPGGCVDAARERFSDDTIDVWMDDEGRLIPLPVWAKMTNTGEDFCGPVLVCSFDDEGGCKGLTPEQVTLVRKELSWSPGTVGAEPSIVVMPWPEDGEMPWPAGRP